MPASPIAAGAAADTVVVVGGGAAGLATALSLAPLKVTLLAPAGAIPATQLAQGGIAAAMGADDAAPLHAQDTLAAAAGLGDPKAAARITAAAPDVIARLAALGAPFDRTAAGALALGLEAAHGHRRIVHARGDATGRAVLETLHAAAVSTPSVTLREDLVALELAVADGRVTGLWGRTAGGRRDFLPARAVVLATGGAGALYASTTNPAGATGSGLILAARAGAVLRDLEFVQFHPTAIAVARDPLSPDPLPLATEALRGEGAILVDAAGRRIMAGVPGAELAPRDVVARAIHGEIAAGRSVFLDARSALGARFAARFPAVHALCRAAGLDPSAEPIPVRPAAHYHMGGVKVDRHGRGSLPGLYACGEVAATGLHGANRLASNSLLEALACAAWIAKHIKSGEAPPQVRAPGPPPREGRAGTPEEIRALRALMDREVGVVRDEAGLRRALSTLQPLAEAARSEAGGLAARGLACWLIATAALRRTESRGGHFRADAPGTDAAPAYPRDLTLAQAGLAAAGLLETA